MAIEYDLYLSPGPKPSEIVAVLLALPGFSGEAGSFSGPGLSGLIGPVHASRRAALEEALKVSASLRVSFRLSAADKNKTEGSGGTHSALEAAFALLRALPGDAALLLNGDSTLLLRTSGTLRLNRARGFWNGPRLDLAPAGRVLEDLPSL